MPELPEIEAWRRLLDPDVKRSPGRAGGARAHRDAEDVRPAARGARGRGLRTARGGARSGFLFPTDDGELVLMVHLMSAGRLKYLAPGAKGPKTPMFRLRFEDGGELVLTEAGAKKRAGVWLLRPDALEQELAHLGPEADQLDAEALGAILASDSRRLHSLLRDQRLIAGIGRAWANEILHVAHALAVRALDPARRRGDRAARRRDPLRDGARASSCGSKGAANPAVYRVHDRLGEPCWRCGTPLARVDFEEHTIYYCTVCQTDGRVLKDRRLSRLLR